MPLDKAYSGRQLSWGADEKSPPYCDKRGKSLGTFISRLRNKKHSKDPTARGIWIVTIAIG